MLKQIKEKYPQYEMNGFKNMWIMKPGGLSRGRGIKLFKNLSKILDHFRNEQQPWVCMKYIENPLIVNSNSAFRKVCLPLLVLIVSSLTSASGCWSRPGSP